MKTLSKIEYNKLLIMGYYGLYEREALEISKDIDIHRFALGVIDMNERERFAKKVSREALAEDKKKLGILNDSIKQ